MPSLLLNMYVLVAASLVSVSASFPKPFELSFSDELQEPCNQARLIQPKRVTRSTVSLCFNDLEDTANNLLRWRIMFTSFQLENRTATIDLMIRRVFIFAPGASFTMAGSRPVSVFSRFRELEIGTHYNGYGKVSDTSNGSIIFKGQLNTTVFEGQIIYQNHNRSHTVQCLHNNSLKPDFYQTDDCLACHFTTYDTHHNPDFPVGWRSGGHSPCHNNLRNNSKRGTPKDEAASDVGSLGENNFDFPRTGFSEYRSNRINPNVQDMGANSPGPFKSRTSGSPVVVQNKISHSTIDTDVYGNDVTAYDTNDRKEIGKLKAKEDKDWQTLSTTESSPGLSEMGPESDQTFTEARHWNRSKRSAMEDDRPTSGQNSKTTTASELETTPLLQSQSPREGETNLSQQNVSKPPDTDVQGATSSNETQSQNSSTTPSTATSFSRSALPQTQSPHDREMQTDTSDKQMKTDTSSAKSHPGEQHTASSSTDSSPPPSHKMPTRRKNRKRNGTDASRSRRQQATRPSSSSQPPPQPHPQAQKASTSEESYTETISCPLHLVADHLFFSEIGEKSPAKTVNLMLSVVIGADAVFRGTDFNGDGVKDNIGFMVKNITIIHNPSLAFYQYSRTNGNSFNYLKSFSTGDFSDVCLGVAFTAIDFQRGVVGLAWYASSDEGGAGKGGICGQRVYLPNEGSSFSFNTAIVSFLNHGSSVSMEMAILTLAHELGHCFGSTHDDMAGSPCNKVYPEGSYLMQKYRPSQYLPNNYKFSPCSLRQMYPVITTKGACFIRYTGPTCGNGVVEEGEECDCGHSEVCGFNDPCCTPGDAPLSSADAPCTVRRSQGMECSPVTFSCCSHVCKHISLADRYVCRKAGNCYGESSCDGQSPLCPASSFQPDGTPCHGAVRACHQGRCRQSLCVRAGLQDCFCKDRPQDRCKLCCRRREEGDARCLPANVFNITSSRGHVMYLLEGDGCLDFKGVCTLDKDQSLVCLTSEQLDGELSELVGLQGGGLPEGDSAVLYRSWFYFIVVPLLFVLMAALPFYGGTMCKKVRHLWVKRRGGGSQNKLLDVLAAAAAADAPSRSDVFHPDVAKAPPSCYRSSGPHIPLHQCPFYSQHQWQCHSSNNAQEDRWYVEERKQGTSHTAPSPYHCPGQHLSRALSMKRVPFGINQPDQSQLKASLSVFDSVSETAALAKDYAHHRHVIMPYRHSKPHGMNRFVNQNRNTLSSSKVQRSSRPVKNLRFSRRRLRANYSKPCLRTPLQRRKTVPTKSSPHYIVTRPTTANDTQFKHTTKIPCPASLKLNGVSHFPMSRRNMMRHLSLHKSLSLVSSESR